MKHKLMTLLCLLLPMAVWSQSKDLTDGKAAVGKWFTDGHDGIVELYIEGDQLQGRIIWMNTDQPLKDKHNKNKALRERPLLGLLIVEGMEWNGEKWDNGKVYDPDTGKCYDCIIWVAEGKLHLRGHIGAFGKTLKWDPAPDEMPGNFLSLPVLEGTGV